MNRDWNTVWDARAARSKADGRSRWPSRSSRCAIRAGQTQIWGVNFKRVVRWKNEVHVPDADSGGARPARASTSLVGGHAGGHRNAAAGSDLRGEAVRHLGDVTDAPPTAAPRLRAQRDGGFDVKVGVTEGLTADFTYNTDFAQVEEDEQQVNLTRFNLFFPGEARVLPRGSGDLLVRRRRDAPRWSARRSATRARRHPGAVLQPPDRAERRVMRCRSTSAARHRQGRARTASALLDIRTGDWRRRASPPRTSASSASSATSCGAARSARSFTDRSIVVGRSRLEARRSASTACSRFSRT